MMPISPTTFFKPNFHSLDMHCVFCSFDKSVIGQFGVWKMTLQPCYYAMFMSSSWNSVMYDIGVCACWTHPGFMECLWSVSSGHQRVVCVFT